MQTKFLIVVNETLNYGLFSLYIFLLMYNSHRWCSKTLAGANTSNVPKLAKVAHVFIASNLYCNNFLLNISTPLAKRLVNSCLPHLKCLMFCLSVLFISYQCLSLIELQLLSCFPFLQPDTFVIYVALLRFLTSGLQWNFYVV